MRTFFLGLAFTISLGACSSIDTPTAPSSFQLSQTFSLDSLAPIGLTAYNNQLWISDGDNNRLVALDEKGSIVQIMTSFERPMHLDSDEKYLYVPEYSLDSIRLLDKTGQRTTLPVGIDLDAPAGISVLAEQVAIADFYEHRVVYYNKNKQWTTIGKKGTQQGEFHYPTDVQLTHNKLYVADAYNHRIQVFNHQGQHLQTIGEQDSMNATTGLHVADSLLAATDFEHNRVLIYTTQGKLLQVITEHLDKPTDVLFWQGDLYILNYGNGILQQYVWQ